MTEPTTPQLSEDEPSVARVLLCSVDFWIGLGIGIGIGVTIFGLYVEIFYL